MTMTIEQWIAANTTSGAMAPPDILQSAVESAVRAPSGHNLQPWRFRLGFNFIDLFADQSRALPILDPEGRELIMSCGAALYYLRLALRHAGCELRVIPIPDPTNPDWLARIYAFCGSRATAEETRLFEAIALRHSSRTPFQIRPVAPELPLQLASAAATEGVVLQPLRRLEEQTGLIALLNAGAHAQAASEPFRREMAGWLHSGAQGEGTGEGVTNFPIDIGNLMTYSGALGSEAADAGEHFAAHLSALAESASFIGVLCTKRDSVGEWLEAGQALAHTLLLAAAQGIQAAFLNAPIQQEALRSELGKLVGGLLHPQCVLAFGYAPYISPTPRRPIADVLV